MAVTRYRPIRFQPVRPVSARLRPLGFQPLAWSDLFDEAIGTSPGMQEPAVHLDRSDDGITVRADLPGVRRDDVEVSATPDGDGVVVTLNAVRHLGDGEQRFAWSARLLDIDPESISASLSDGVLTVRAATRPGPVARSIEVSVEESTDVAAALDVASAESTTATTAEEAGQSDEPA